MKFDPIIFVEISIIEILRYSSKKRSTINKRKDEICNKICELIDRMVK